MNTEVGTRRSWIKTALLAAFLVASLSASVFAVRHAPEPIVDWLLETDIRSQAQLWQKRVLMQLDDDAGSFQSQSLSVDEKQRLSRIPDVADYFRISFIGMDGTVFWSSHAESNGQMDHPPTEASHAAGELSLNHLHFHPEEIEDLARHALNYDEVQDRTVYEIYAPVVRNSTRIGAIKFYSDVTLLHETFLQSISDWLFIAACVVLFLMTLAIGLIVYTSRKQLKNLQERAREEREMMQRQIRLAREVKLLGELNEWLQSSRSLTELFDMVARFMKHILPESEGSLYVYSNSRDVLDGSASWNGGSHHEHIHPEACWGLRRGRSYQFGQSEVDFACEHTEPNDGRPYFCFPILALGETVGLMHLKKHKDATSDAFDESRRLAQMCAEQISMAIANVRMRDQLEDRSIRDPLTGLFNRRHMLDSMRKLIARADANASHLHLVYIDVDHFKKFNDNHGHDAGDMVLRAVGDLLIKNCDGDEVPCRMGGEEFMLLLPDLPQPELKDRIESLRRDVAAISVRYGEKALPKITISSGIASYPDHGRMPQDLLRVADEALYKAKDNGRNQVVVAQVEKPGNDASKNASPQTPPHGLAAE
ncbi:diguanylate cyclase [uncultured Roseovarius sp.]|uniref:sensor domain-containing diguanylate cyclase n=1 Tax=uncultured Roseovarius sp. TaxID=293344 RepID=UPI0026188434|nr:diguanylate cyclase [uncultured Roseovarius sp.]